MIWCLSIFIIRLTSWIRLLIIIWVNHYYNLNIIILMSLRVILDIWNLIISYNLQFIWNHLSFQFIISNLLILSMVPLIIYYLSLFSWYNHIFILQLIMYFGILLLNSSNNLIIIFIHLMLFRCYNIIRLINHNIHVLLMLTLILRNSWTS